MDGIYIMGRRPKSKKEVKEKIATSPGSVTIETTSFFSNRGNFSANEIAEGETISFVGPDPHTDRRFYGSITRKGGVLTVK